MYALICEDGFYVGKSYLFQGGRYAVVDWGVEKAKKYTSKKRAENTMKSLNQKCGNYIFEVKELAS